MVLSFVVVLDAAWRPKLTFLQWPIKNKLIIHKRLKQKDLCLLNTKQKPWWSPDKMVSSLKRCVTPAGDRKRHSAITANWKHNYACYSQTWKQGIYFYWLPIANRGHYIITTSLLAWRTPYWRNSVILPVIPLKTAFKAKIAGDGRSISTQHKFSNNWLAIFSINYAIYN